METAFGVKMEAVAYDNTKEMITALQDGEIDIAAGVHKSMAYTGLKYIPPTTRNT